MVFRSWQSWVSNNIRHNVGDLIHLVHDLVHIDAGRLRQLAIVTISAGVQQHFVVFVLLGVEHVVALLAEPDAYKAWAFGGHFKYLNKEEKR